MLVSVGPIITGIQHTDPTNNCTPPQNQQDLARQIKLLQQQLKQSRPTNALGATSYKCKPPGFWKFLPHSWFVQAVALFTYHDIQDDSIHYNVVVMALQADIL